MSDRPELSNHRESRRFRVNSSPHLADDALSAVLDTFRLRVEIINNAQYCGDWGVDTSGTAAVSFHVVTHGSCYLSCEHLSGPMQLQTGDLVVFPADSPHSLRPSLESAAPLNQQLPRSYRDGLKADGVGLLCGYIRLRHPAATTLLAALPEVIVRQRNVNTPTCALTSLLELIHCESLETGPGVQAAVERLTEALFVLLLRQHIDSAGDVGIIAALGDKRIRRALDAMHSRLDHPWTLAELASEATMSRSGFSDSFKRLLGEGAIEYLTRWRMHNAWLWLSEEGATVAEVADRCGYQSEAAFSKAFKRITGEGPGAIRRST